MRDERKPIHGWIQTFSGKQFFPLDPDPKLIDVTDIAVSLSREPRFSGHTKIMLSVAQHSVLVQRIVAKRESSPELQLVALMHDAHEAYLKDIPRPVVIAMGEEFAARWKGIKKRLDAAIAERFGFDAELFEHPAIKYADSVALATEKRDLMGPEPWPWHPLLEPRRARIEPWSSGTAEMVFNSVFRRLQEVACYTTASKP
jgi:hypothetical protein